MFYGWEVMKTWDDWHADVFLRRDVIKQNWGQHWKEQQSLKQGAFQGILQLLFDLGRNAVSWSLGFISVRTVLLQVLELQLQH